MAAHLSVRSAADFTSRARPGPRPLCGRRIALTSFTDAYTRLKPCSMRCVPVDEPSRLVGAGHDALRPSVAISATRGRIPAPNDAAMRCSSPGASSATISRTVYFASVRCRIRRALRLAARYSSCHPPAHSPGPPPGHDAVEHAVTRRWRPGYAAEPLIVENSNTRAPAAGVASPGRDYVHAEVR